MFTWVFLQDEREMQLNDIDVVILLPEDRFKTLKPSETTSFEDCVLVNKNNMSKINEQINEYETETLNELAKQKYTQQYYLHNSNKKKTKDSFELETYICYLNL